MKARDLTKQEFINEIANYKTNEWKFLGKRPAIVDFYATWCGPCKMMAPILDEMAEEFAGKVDVYKVNVDSESELADAFNVRSVPTLLFIPMNGKPQISSGAMPRTSLKEAIQKVLLND